MSARPLFDQPVTTMRLPSVATSRARNAASPVTDVESVCACTEAPNGARPIETGPVVRFAASLNLRVSGSPAAAATVAVKLPSAAAVAVIGVAPATAVLRKVSESGASPTTARAVPVMVTVAPLSDIEILPVSMRGGSAIGMMLMPLSFATNAYGGASTTSHAAPEVATLPATDGCALVTLTSTTP